MTNNKRKNKNRPKAKAGAKKRTPSTRKTASDKLVQMQGAVSADNSNTVAKLMDTVAAAERDAQALLHGEAGAKTPRTMESPSAALLQKQVSLHVTAHCFLLLPSCARRKRSLLYRFRSQY